MTDTTERRASITPARQAAYDAVWASGQLTSDAWANARIWRSVEAALDACEAALPDPARVWDEGWYALEIWDGSDEERANPYRAPGATEGASS